jgi:hypothetical protein
MWDTVPTIVHDSGLKKRVADIVSCKPAKRVTKVGDHDDASGTITAMLFYDVSSSDMFTLSVIDAPSFRM